MAKISQESRQELLERDVEQRSRRNGQQYEPPMPLPEHRDELGNHAHSRQRHRPFEEPER